jgi:hypothetical protein
MTARQLVPGSGEGQHTSTRRDYRRRLRSRSGCPIKREGLRGHGLCAHERSLTQRDKSDEHSLQAHPVDVQLGVGLTRSAHY